MSKTIPCFICKVSVEAHTDKAIAKLCPEHDNEENREAMANTPIHQLLRIVDDGIKQELADNQTDTMAKIEALKQQIKQLEEAIQTKIEINDVPAPAQSETKNIGNVNEYGEII